MVFYIIRISITIKNHIIYKVQWLFMCDDYYLNVLHEKKQF